MSHRLPSGPQSRRAFLRDATVLGFGAATLVGCRTSASAGGTAAGATAAGATAVANSAGGAARAAGFTAPSANGVGVQLYTVRDLLQQDFEGTLEKVAQVGYRRVELAGMYDRKPEQVRAVLDRLQLTAPSAHVGANLLRQDMAQQIQIAKTLGHEYITAPSFPIPRTGGTEDAWKQAAAEFNRFGTACREAGLRFAYHNHNWELAPIAGGRSGLDVLLAETDPALVDFELDLYWAAHAGRDPLALFAQYPGRFTMWHVKDMREPQGAKAMAPVGQGTLDFRAMFAKAQQSGLRHFFVEHDNAAQTGGSLASIQASFAHLRQLLS